MIPHFPPPDMPTVLGRHDAKDVLNNGVVRATGPHIHPTPQFWDGHKLMPVPPSKPFPAQLTAGATRTVGTPTDAGSATHDYKGAMIWTPSIDDVNQWPPTCYFMGPIAGAEQAFPWELAKLVVATPTGFTVNFFANGVLTPIAVPSITGTPPIASAPNPTNGACGSVIAESAWCWQHGNGTYASIAYGASIATYSALGMSSLYIGLNLTAIQATFASKLSATAQSYVAQPAGSVVVENHDYPILGVTASDSNPISEANALIQLYNPWGPTGAPNGGLVTLTWAEFCLCFAQVNVVNGLPYKHLMGDVNDDGVVDIRDLQLVSNNWQMTVIPWTNGDANGDGVVNILDLQIVSSEWQQAA